MVHLQILPLLYIAICHYFFSVNYSKRILKFLLTLTLIADSLCLIVVCLHSSIIIAVFSDQEKADDDASKEKGDKPKFRKELAPVEVESGQPGRLECAIEGNPANFTVTWYKDGEEIVPNEQYGIVQEPDGTLALLVDSFSAKDAGQYSVKVKVSYLSILIFKTKI